MERILFCNKETTHGNIFSNGILALASAVFIVTLFWPVPSIAGGDDACISCHGDYTNIHGGDEHTVGNLIGSVVLFADDQHDSAGWEGPKPYFDVAVNCNTCHLNNLKAIHANNCETCHPDPYESLGGNWGGTCQQGGCHQTYHENSTTAHLPFEPPIDSVNDCSRCHDQQTWVVSQFACLNCHASNVSDSTPPVTSSNAQAIYEGGATIVFSISDNGKVGIGTTFYKLDNDTVVAGSQVISNNPGEHTLQFWSVDQSGNVESPVNTISFKIFSETIPPVTTSDSKSAYYKDALITLTATDNSPNGVKATYYRLNDGPTQTGTKVLIPATPGTVGYTLTYWSEDWGYNIEEEKSESFTVTGGNGTIRLVWGNSDQPGYGPDSGDEASWTVWRGSFGGQVVSLGSSAASNWDGVDDIVVPVHSTPYFVRVYWYWAEDEEEGSENFGPIYISTPGQVSVNRY